jgi:polysaccharide export outer membrane protein
MMTTMPLRYAPPLVLVLALAALALLSGAPVAEAVEPYVIGPEDVLDIQVWDNRDLNHVVFVRPDGMVSLPLLGEVPAGGRTVKQLQDDLTQLYSKTVKVPSVTVIIKEIKSRPVFFIGGFGRPGVLQLTRDLTLIQAVSIIGGVVPGADAEKGYLLRGDKRTPIDFTKMVQKGDLSQNLKLEPGDSVVAPIADMVFVEGEVKRPGAQKYTNDLTILKAITLAGGFTPLAASGRVDLLRTEGEKKVRIRLDLDKLMRAPEENPDMKLRADDIIFVPQRLF